MSASVAVCMCTYNGARHLGEQLTSLGSQTRLPDEIVISDDGSKDGTLDLLERWAASACTSVSIEAREAPVGHVANLESALRRACSDIIFICDQDDRWSPEKVQRLAQVLEGSPAPAGAFCDSSIIDEAGDPVAGSLWQTLRFVGAEQESVARGSGLQVLLRRNVVAGHALALRRARLDLLLPFPDVDHADWWLALGLLLDGGLVPLSERLVDYRLHSANAVGLRSRTSVPWRIAATRPRDRSARDAALLDDLVRRFDSLRPGSLSDADRTLVRAKIAHSLRRSSLSPRRLSRVVPVVKGLASGDYALLEWTGKRADRPCRLGAMSGLQQDSELPVHDVAAVVVNYNAGAALSECVASLESERVQAIVVVDNGSTDDSLECLARENPGVQVFRTGQNLGFGGGANYGAKRTTGEMLLVCNPDLVLRPGALGAMVDRLMQDPSLGLVGPALVTPSGDIQPSGRAFPTLRRSMAQAVLGVLLPKNAYSQRYREANRTRAGTGIVDWVTGACFLVRRVAFDAVGGFDDRYFMYVEEVDLCWRLARAGWRTGYESSAQVLHLAGISTAPFPYRMIVAHHLSLWRYARRTTRGSERILLPVVAVGIACRCVVVCLRSAVVRMRRRG